MDDSSERQHIAMALHQQRQAKCREVRAASLAQQLNQHIKSPSSTRMADNIREFYRTPTMLAEDEPLFSADQPNQEKLEEGGGGDIWGAASLDDPSTTSYDVNSLADDSGAQESQLRPTTNEAFADGGGSPNANPALDFVARCRHISRHRSLDFDKSTPKIDENDSRATTSTHKENTGSEILFRLLHILSNIVQPSTVIDTYYASLRVVDAFKASLPSRLAGLNRESVTSLHRAMTTCTKQPSLTSLNSEADTLPSQPEPPASQLRPSPSPGFHYPKAPPSPRPLS
ncbi:unnamed protein product [Mesocestoides corti]|uniref:Uncharacterized protein n=2 Tax=Mesocestoides corti TaxID=53468 RepID=A0A3P6H2Q4_MESCO|nr:unnamed protein product [Mesocestoides corti]